MTTLIGISEIVSSLTTGSTNVINTDNQWWSTIGYLLSYYFIHVCSILPTGSSNTENVAYGIASSFVWGRYHTECKQQESIYCIKDIPYINDTIKRPLCPNQKPIKFLKRIIKLFNEEDDRVIDVTPRIGKLIYLDIPVITDYT